MYKVSVCGNFGNKTNSLNGQTIKTKILTQTLQRKIGENNVGILNTGKNNKNIISVLIQSLILIKNSDNVVIMPAQNAIKLIPYLFVYFNKIYKKKIHYVVIGGWLPKMLKNNIRLKKIMLSIDEIYVETEYMKNELFDLGLYNIQVMNNFKDLNIVENKKQNHSNKLQLKICTFSRVSKEKGIEDAINVVRKVNTFLDKQAYSLDIYGQIEEKYIDEFLLLKTKFPPFIEYKGTVEYTQTVNTLKQYCFVLFPTQYRTEGLPGTVIDAYAAGLPVIASKWDSAQEIIEEGQTGYIYNMNDIEQLENILIEIYNNQEKISDMKEHCLLKATKYLPENAIITLFNKLHLPN